MTGIQQLSVRERCVVTHSDDMEKLHCMRKFPVFMGCVNTPASEDLREDMSWSISRSSGLIQLDNLLPLEVLYPESHGAGVIGTMWENHHKAFAKFLFTTKPKSVLEIGGAHGILSREYGCLDNIPWTIIEPNPSPVSDCSARFIKGFFDDKFEPEESYDTVVHSHVFEHIYEPDLFMLHLSEFMSEGHQLIFSLPNMLMMLKRYYTNCINFEHTVFLTEPYVEYLLSKHGFELLSKKYFMDDHSIFYSAVRNESVTPSPLPAGLYSTNEQIFWDYVNYHDQLIDEINGRIRNVQESVYLFGAHVFAQYLIQSGLDTSRIEGLLDNDPNKQGKRLYGTDLMVSSPKVLAALTSPLVILKAGVYNQEIKDDILNNINASTIFIE